VSQSQWVIIADSKPHRYRNEPHNVDWAIKVAKLVVRVLGSAGAAQFRLDPHTKLGKSPEANASQALWQHVDEPVLASTSQR
jgi:hypothetical protein